MDQTIRHFTPSDTAYQLINDSPLGEPDNPAPAVPTSDELLDGVQYGRGTRTGQTNKWGAWLTETDGVGRTTTYERDDANNLTRQTYPDGDCVEYSYDENGNRLTEDRIPINVYWRVLPVIHPKSRSGLMPTKNVSTKLRAKPTR